MFDAQQGARRPGATWTRRAVSGVAATVLGSLMLLGCTGGDGEPTPPPPSESTTSAPPSPSPSPPEELPSPSTSPAPDGVDARLVEPDEMKRDDEVGAIAAAKYYLGLFEYVHETGDLEKWESMALKGCTFCASVAEGVRDLHAKGEWIETGAFVWHGEPELEFIKGVNVWEVKLDGETQVSRKYDSKGAVTEEVQPGEVEILIGVVYLVDGWLVQGVKVSGG